MAYNVRKWESSTIEKEDSGIGTYTSMESLMKHFLNPVIISHYILKPRSITIANE